MVSALRPPADLEVPRQVHADESRVDEQEQRGIQFPSVDHGTLTSVGGQRDGEDVDRAHARPARLDRAERFLVRVKESLEDPQRLVLDL